MITKIIDFLKKYDLADKTIIVGFSGGNDSMCLLDALSKIKKLEEFSEMTIIAAHYNHNWRGDESFAEQEVCRKFANEREIEFYTETASGNIKKNENSARIARYEFFEKAYDEYDADAVFTAHNHDDNAETVMYRVIKGTGLVGLKGISPKRRYFYRPMLKVTRAEILEYCEKHNLSPNQDSSNFDTTYNRNYIRLNVLPALEHVNPSVKEALNNLAQVAANEDAIIEEYIQKFRDLVFDEDKINSAEYKKLSEPVKLRLLHEYIRKIELDYDFKKIRELYDFIEKNILKRNGSTISIDSSRWLYVDEKIIETIPPSNKQKPVISTAVEITGEGEYKISGKTLIIKKTQGREAVEFPESEANFLYADLSAIDFPLYLRTRREGDVISPFGMSGKMKLKKYLNSKGVCRHKRDELILLADKEEVLWVVGVGISSKIGVAVCPTHVIELI